MPPQPLPPGCPASGRPAAAPPTSAAAAGAPSPAVPPRLRAARCRRRSSRISAPNQGSSPAAASLPSAVGPAGSGSHCGPAGWSHAACCSAGCTGSCSCCSACCRRDKRPAPADRRAARRAARSLEMVAATASHSACCVSPFAAASCDHWPQSAPCGGEDAPLPAAAQALAGAPPGVLPLPPPSRDSPCSPTPYRDSRLRPPSISACRWRQRDDHTNGEYTVCNTLSSAAAGGSGKMFAGAKRLFPRFPLTSTPSVVGTADWRRPAPLAGLAKTLLGRIHR